MAWEILDQFGPTYNVEGAGLKGFRRAARKGLSALTCEERQAYGTAVEAAVLAKQRAEFLRAAGEPEKRPNCASGTWLSDGADISRAVRNQQNRALLACPGMERRAREPDTWRAMYAEAMADKQQRLAA